jgi:hypothetical protein
MRQRSCRIGSTYSQLKYLGNMSIEVNAIQIREPESLSVLHNLLYSFGQYLEFIAIYTCTTIYDCNTKNLEREQFLRT